MTELLDTLADDFLRDYFAFYPTNAANLGLHEYDGQITDLSAGAIAARVSQLQGFRRRLAELDDGRWQADGTDSSEHRASSSVSRLTYGLLHWRIEAELWSWTVEREHLRNPLFYAYNIIVDCYVKRNYAPLEIRLVALVQHLRRLPQAMAVAQQNLAHSLPRPLVEEALRVFPGLISFLNESLPEAIAAQTRVAALSPALARELWAARDLAAAALQGFVDYLRYTLLPASYVEFAVGARQFAQMLRYNELVDLSLEKLLAIGVADLARNQEAIAALAAQRNPRKSVAQQMRELGRNHPPAARLLDETRAMLEGLRDFLIARDLVSLPSEARCRVESTPSFARWAFAMMDTAGPFETVADESFYYLTLPEPAWSPAQSEGWLSKFDYATLVGTSIHEAYPGHFLHALHMRNAPSRLAKVFWSYAHTESWAHYVEQMMLDQGYGDGNADLRLAQLAEALVRNCRYVCAIKMHTEGMSIAEATRFFMQHAYMDEVTAGEEARRGAHDPGYLNYTLGKLMLLKLLADYKAAYGSDFSLKRFHDEYIGYGAPPIPLLRKLMLPYDDGVLL